MKAYQAVPARKNVSKYKIVNENEEVGDGVGVFDGCYKKYANDNACNRRICNLVQQIKS